MFKQLEYINYLLVNDIGNIYDVDGFFYDLGKYHKDKLIIDLPDNFIYSDLYPRYTQYLEEKGYHVSYKGIVNNFMFGLPVFNQRCVIVCSKNSYNPILKNLFYYKNEYVTPLSLLNGKDIKLLKKEFLSYNKPFHKSETINTLWNDITDNHYDRSLMLDFIDNACNLNDRSHFKFKDKSNNLPKKKPIIDIEDRITPYGRIFSDKKEHYYHYNTKRGLMTIREIARLNGVPDDWSIDMTREEFIDFIDNSISPYIIKKIWGVLY